MRSECILSEMESLEIALMVMVESDISSFSDYAGCCVVRLFVVLALFLSLMLMLPVYDYIIEKS